MKDEPCKVCGNTDMNLIDGFYYCVECGTQDVNLMETMIENMMLSDGTYAIRQRTKITKIVRSVEKVSPEWYKWQTYNYILSGMVKEVMDLGAGPKFKMRVMWLWTLYVKKFQKKQELGLSGEDEEVIDNTRSINRVIINRKKHGKVDHYKLNIGRITVNLFLTIIYLALNFDRSEILASDLIRFIREGRLSFRNSVKYLPQEINVSLVEGFKRFNLTVNPNVDYTNTQAMTILKTLELGSPIVPDLKKIVERYIKELCLPEGFKDLVLSLMDIVPCDYLDLDKFIMKQITSIPFYEGRVMAYILVALKMCFGLDDNYEIKLSDAVDHINNENCHMKCYKLGVFSTSSDRLFCFREWVKFLQLRKLVLSRCYVPLALLYHMDVDDYVYMEQRNVTIPYKKQASITDDIIMSLLEKIRTDTRKEVIPKSAFYTTLTPLTTYTDVIQKQYHDPEVRLLLSEDFTQYSLKYAYESLDLRVSDDGKNIITGVDEANKCVRSVVESKLSSANKYRDSSLVFIRNCENKHWLKTKPPTKNHIKKVKRDHDVDVDIDSMENFPSDSETDSNHDETVGAEDVNTDKKLEFIEEDHTENIFDDDFQNLEEYEEKTQSDLLKVKDEPIDEEYVEHTVQNNDLLSTNVEYPDLNSSLNLANASLPNEEDIENFFNPETFNREEAIKELLLLTCKKYKISIPKEYRKNENKEPRKRKVENVNEENNAVSEKKSKTRVNPGDTRKQVNILLSAYYDSLRHDVFSSLTPHIRDLVDSLHPGCRENINIEDQINENIENIAQDNLNESNVGNTNDGNQVDDPSLVEIQNGTLSDSDSVLEEAENAYKRDPKFDDRIYDVKQLYLEMDDENLEDIFDIHDDPEVDEIISKKMNELASDSLDSNSKIDKIDESYNAWDDEVPLSDIQDLMLGAKEVRENSFKDLEYLVSNKKEITKNNYWVRREEIMSRVQNRADSFTNEMKESFPKSFSFLVMECAAMLDCTPFILYKYMVQIEEYLIL